MKKLRSAIIITICVGLCVGYYYYLSNRDLGKNDAPTELEQVINKDLDKSYPSTAREVVKFYNRILCCAYNEKVSDEEMKNLVRQARKLFDEELLEENPENVHLLSFQTEVEEYTDGNSKITNVTVSNSNEVVYKEVQGDECAYVEASYYIKGKKDSYRAGQTYILRKDQNDRWKILGYYRPE